MILKFDTLETFTTPESSDLFHRIYITAHADGKPAGFVRIIYIGKEIAEKKLKDSLQFFIYKINYSNEELHKAYEDGNLELLCKKLKSFNRSQTGDLLRDWEIIQQNIHETYHKKHEEFVDYWVDKPSRELIYVVNETTKFFGIIDGNEEVSTSIEPHNWQGCGIGRELVEQSVKYTEKLKLNLWQSNNQTKQGLKLWKFSVPGYQILHAPSKTEYFNNQRAYTSPQT